MKKFRIIGQGNKSYTTRRVKRTWFNKKLGKKITKVYEYKGYKTTKRSQKLIVKNGKLTKYGKEYKEALIRKLGNDFRYKVEEKIFVAEKNDANLKESTLVGQIERALEQAENKYSDDSASRSKIRGFIYNMGGDVDDLAIDLGIDKKTLLDESNWRFVNSEEAYFTFGGYQYSFNFKYEENTIVWQRKKVK